MNNPPDAPLKYGRSILRRYIVAYSLWNATGGGVDAVEDLHKLEGEIAALVEAKNTLDKVRSIMSSRTGSNMRKLERLNALLAKERTHE